VKYILGWERRNLKITHPTYPEAEGGCGVGAAILADALSGETETSVRFQTLRLEERAAAQVDVTFGANRKPRRL
jgi:hypothetical protein